MSTQHAKKGRRRSVLRSLVEQFVQEVNTAMTPPETDDTPPPSRFTRSSDWSGALETNSRRRRPSSISPALRRVLSVTFLSTLLLSMANLYASLAPPQKSKEFDDSPVLVGTANGNKKSKNTTMIPQQQRTLILHVGPQKTMSTTLQCSFRHHEQVLAEDSFQFLGKIDYRVCGDAQAIGPFEFPIRNQDYCLDKMIEAAADTQAHDNSTSALYEAMQSVPCWFNHTQLLKSYNAQNLILSNEKYSEIHVGWFEPHHHQVLWPLLKHEFRRHHWNVQVVVVYRRYYEWIASLKNQADKYYYGLPGMRKWRGPTIVPLMDHLQTVLHDKNPQPYVTEIVQLYRDILGFNVTILNMHDGRDLVESFLCDVLDAPHTCAHHRQEGGMGDEKINPSVSPFYDMITLAAWRRNLIPDKIHHNRTHGLERMHVSMAAALFHTKVLNATGPLDLELICPNRTTVQPVLDRTLEYEQALLPEFFASPLGQVQLRAEFWQAVERKKFCTVDIDRVLSDPHWLAFFASLKGGKKKGRNTKGEWMRTVDRYYTNLEKYLARTNHT